jgi:hypothetical protein
MHLLVLDGAYLVAPSRRCFATRKPSYDPEDSGAARLGRK